MISLLILKIFIPVSRIYDNEDDIFIFSRNVRKSNAFFLLIDATDRSKISSGQKRFFIAWSLYPFNFSRTLLLRKKEKGITKLNKKKSNSKVRIKKERRKRGREKSQREKEEVWSKGGTGVRRALRGGA